MPDLSPAAPACLGVYVGRFSPVHIGHQAVIDVLRRDFGDRCMVVIGSATAPQSMRHFFSYADRRGFLRALYPDLTLTGLADFPTDREWLLALDDQIALMRDPGESVVFFGGCREDVEFFIEDGREVCLFNRFDGTTPKISATEVRDALLRGRGVDGLLDPRIAGAVRETFDQRWAAFSKR